MPPDIGMLPKPDEINALNANQEDDGTIIIPEVLRPYMNNMEKISPISS